MRRSLFLLTPLFCLAGTLTPSLAEVPATDLATLVHESTVITLARVDRVLTLEGHSWAEAVPTRVLKGSPTRSLYFFAEASWSCDISTASLGETVLLFLIPAPHTPPPTPTALTPEASFEQQLLRALEPDLTRPVAPASIRARAYLIAHDGRGRMPVLKRNHSTLATVFGDVVLPPDLRVLSGPDPSRTFETRTSLPDLLDHVTGLLKGLRKGV